MIIQSPQRRLILLVATFNCLSFASFNRRCGTYASKLHERQTYVSMPRIEVRRICVWAPTLILSQVHTSFGPAFGNALGLRSVNEIWQLFVFLTEQFFEFLGRFGQIDFYIFSKLICSPAHNTVRESTNAFLNITMDVQPLN